ncbi:hypothetical protein GCM10027343_22070 [Noviherbaspirillum agri]
MVRKPTQRGAAAIEFALMLVIMIPLAFGITELGRAFYQYNSLVKATRDGARVLAKGGSGAAGAARCFTVYGNPTCSGTPVIEGLAEAMVQTTTDQEVQLGALTVKMATVTITGYQFKSLVPMVVTDIGFGPISSTMRQS